MKIIRDLQEITLNEPLTASIGGFDGIHIGHQKIIENVVRNSIKNNTKSANWRYNFWQCHIHFPSARN